MKKLFYCLLAVIIGLSSLTSCSANLKKTHITQQKAKIIAETIVKNTKQAQIIKYSAPKVDKVQEKQSHKVCPVSKNKPTVSVDLKGKTVWKVTYKTKQDGLLGPITVYIDYYSGKIYGIDIRY